MLPKQFKLPFASNKNSLEKIFGDNPINCHSGLAKHKIWIYLPVDTDKRMGTPLPFVYCFELQKLEMSHILQGNSNNQLQIGVISLND